MFQPQLLRWVPDAPLTLRVRGVLLVAVASYARSGRVGQIFDGGSALPASAKLHGSVVILRDDGSPVAT